MTDDRDKGNGNPLKGSKLRCCRLTEPPAEEVARRLSKLLGALGHVTTADNWMPKGCDDPGEATLSKRNGFLPEADCDTLRKWWLAAGTVTPRWALVSTFAGGEQIAAGATRKGLLLVEAKAHFGELKREGKRVAGKASPGTLKNHEQIRGAISEANGALRGFRLSRDSHYQLSNRFAWAWKIASLGVPVVLVYLGFLNCTEMTEYRILRDESEWTQALLEHADGVVPETAWNNGPLEEKLPLYPVIQSLYL